MPCVICIEPSEKHSVGLRRLQKRAKLLSFFGLLSCHVSSKFRLIEDAPHSRMEPRQLPRELRMFVRLIGERLPAFRERDNPCTFGTEPPLDSSRCPALIDPDFFEYHRINIAFTGTGCHSLIAVATDLYRKNKTPQLAYISVATSRPSSPKPCPLVLFDIRYPLAVRNLRSGTFLVWPTTVSRRPKVLAYPFKPARVSHIHAWKIFCETP